jgi:hypothetical protein
MTLRHKAVKATLDKGLATEWNDDHTIDFTDELVFYDTFFFGALQAFWSTAQCANGGTAAIALVTGHNFVKVESSAGAGGLGVLRLGTTNMTNKTDTPIATFSAKLDTIKALEIGFFRAADTPFTANQDGAYFRISADKIYAVTGDGADEEANDITPVGFAINQYFILRIEFTATYVKFYINNLVTAVQNNTTHITTEDLTLKASAAVSGGASQILHMDGIGLQRLRKK